MSSIFYIKHYLACRGGGAKHIRFDNNKIKQHGEDHPKEQLFEDIFIYRTEWILLSLSRL